MRRATILRLLGIVLVVVLAGYSALWWVAAGRIKLAAGDWARAAHEKQLDVSWQTLRVAGFPLTFRIELGDAVVSDKAANPPVELRAPQLSASIWPWNFREVWFAVPNGVDARFGSDAASIAKLVAAAADGAAVLGKDGTTTIWLTLYRPQADAGLSVAARRATTWIILPARAAESHLEPRLSAAALIEELALPVSPPAFSSTVDQLGLGLTLMGGVPKGPLKAALAAWRDAGGTLELDHLDLHWGTLGVTASGTLALDGDLQPVGGFSGAISGYDQLMTALVAAGRIKAGDARVARLALAMLGKVGADGRPEISTSMTIQNGEISLGPAHLGKAPHIDW